MSIPIYGAIASIFAKGVGNKDDKPRCGCGSPRTPFTCKGCGGAVCIEHYHLLSGLCMWCKEIADQENTDE